VKADAAGVLRSAVTGLPIVLYRIGAGLAEWEKGIALLMVLALAMGTVRLVRAPWRPELAGAAVVWLVLVGTLAIRGDSIEIRYFSLGSTLLAMLLVVPLAPASARARWLALPLVAYLALGVVPQDLGMLRYMTGPNADHATMRSAMQASVEGAPEGARVISPVPYFFTFWTRRGAISPPYPGKAELVEVMRRYNAPIVLLPTDSLDYYYPGGPDALRPEVQLDRSIDRFTLLRRTPN